MTEQLNFGPEEMEALHEIARERVEIKRAAAAAAAREEEARKLDHEKALARLEEEERIKRQREQVWGKNPQRQGGEGVTAWERGR